MKTLILKKVTLGNMILLLSFTLILSIATVGSATSSFTAVKTASGNNLTSGTLDLTASPATAMFTISNMVPGDTMTRTLTITNSGNSPLTYTIASSTVGSTLLWSDLSNGLKLTVNNVTTSTTLFAANPISALTTNSVTLAAGATQTIDFKIDFPSGANNTFQNLSEVVTFTFNATQLAGAAR